MKARRLDPFTGDLFVADSGPAVPTARGASAVPIAPALPAAPAVSVAAAMPAASTASVAPRPAPAGTRDANALWYAVEFPGLDPEARVLPRLALHAFEFTPLVSLEPPQALLLELRGSVRLFGSLDRLRDAIDATWRRLALQARSAVAPSTLAALWLARSGGCTRLDAAPALPGALAPLPLAVSGWDAQTLSTLRAMGVQRVGELLRLPRAGLARRFGPGLLRDLDIALGRVPAPRRRFVPRERFRERCDFEREVETLEELLELLAPILGRCAHFLRTRQAGVRSLELRLRHRERAPSRLRFGLASITSERTRLLDTVRHTLSRGTLAAPARGLELRSGPLEPLSAASLDVFRLSRTGRGDTAPQLIERLRARLGERSVYGVRLRDEHRPEQAWRREAVLEVDRPARLEGGAAAARLQASRPLWLLEEPQALVAQGPPRSRRGRLVLEEGPERIESGWWEGADVARDYYCAREPGGARLWVFKALDTGAWFVHGVFA